jgi:hypothetical protein
MSDIPQSAHPFSIGGNRLELGLKSRARAGQSIKEPRRAKAHLFVSGYFPDQQSKFQPNDGSFHRFTPIHGNDETKSDEGLAAWFHLWFLKWTSGQRRWPPTLHGTSDILLPISSMDVSALN